MLCSRLLISLTDSLGGEVQVSKGFTCFGKKHMYQTCQNATEVPCEAHTWHHDLIVDQVDPTMVLHRHCGNQVQQRHSVGSEAVYIIAYI